MRILHLIDSGGLYGAERMILTLMERQRDAGHEAVLLSAGVPDEAPKAVEVEARVRDLDVRAWRMAPRFNRGEAARILAWIQDERFDVAHVHGYKFNVLLGMFSRRRRRVPLVSTLHGYISGKPLTRAWVYVQADKWILPRLDAVVLVSEAIRARIPGSIARKGSTVVVPNGIDLVAVRDQAEGEVPADVATFCDAHGPVLLGVGRLSSEKGFDRVLRIAQRLRAALPSLGVVLVGQGPLREELAAQASSLGVPLALPGFSDRVPAIMRRCDLLCMPSHTEGLPLTLLEAMTVGLPIAATPVGEIARVLDEGRGGVILDRHDEEAMAAAVREQLADDARREAMVAWSREQVAAVYSSASMARAYDDVYRAVISSSSAA